MDPDPPIKLGSGSSSSASAPPSTPFSSQSSQRKERGAIAAQACDTCRSRKQKCDEQRPKCSTCQKFNLDCNYREPQPTKKDKTLVEILDRIKGLEDKIDTLSLRGNSPIVVNSTPINYSQVDNEPLVSHAPSLLAAAGMGGVTMSSVDHLGTSGITPPASQYSYVSSAHQMFNWPVIQQLLVPLGADGLQWNPSKHDEPSKILGSQDLDASLPHEPAGAITFEYPPVLPGLALPNTIGPRAAVGGMSGIPPAAMALTWDSMQRLSKAYFDTFNFLCPVMDRQLFSSDIMTTVLEHGFDRSITSTLAFLVFALGEVAIAAVEGPPIAVYDGRASGVRGGVAQQPPGLALYNEARKRMGFNLTECSLENIQVFVLAGLYCGTSSRHMEVWRMSTNASLACLALITSKPSELTSIRADMIKRAFWYCSILETYFNLELGLPLTGLGKLEEMTGLPDFSGPYSQDDYLGNQASHFQEHFASQIALRRLAIQFNGTLSQSNLYNSYRVTDDGSPANLPSTMRQLASHLDQWRGMLPAHLRWSEDQPAEFSNPMQSNYKQAMFPPTATPVPSVSSPTGFMFTTDLDSAPIRYPYAIDVQVALLRTRYYYCKFLIYRPFIYKALHHPEQMTQEDAQGAAQCLMMCLKWPIAMSPTSAHKRLIPCSVIWTQNIVGILVLLHLSRKAPVLQRIRTLLCGERFEVEAQETVGLYMNWIRDLRGTDKAAAWGWEVVRAVYDAET